MFLEKCLLKYISSLLFFQLFWLQYYSYIVTLYSFLALYCYFLFFLYSFFVLVYSFLFLFIPMTLFSPVFFNPTQSNTSFPLINIAFTYVLLPIVSYSLINQSTISIKSIFITRLKILKIFQSRDRFFFFLADSSLKKN